MSNQATTMSMGPTMKYDGDAFIARVQQLRGTDEHRGLCIVLLGAESEARRDAVVRLTETTGLNLHEFDMSTLLAERDHQTQGNLREAFDGAREQAALLYFNKADALYAADALSKVEEERDDDAHTPVDYFHQRIEGFSGLVLLDVQDAGLQARLEPLDADLVVTF